MNVLEKILEEIEEASIKVSTVKEHAYFKAVGTRKIKEIIRSHMNEVDDGWIPVEERLPEEECNVLVTVNGRCKSTRFENAIMLGEYDEVYNAWVIEGWEDWENPNVVAWQPLPEAYHPKQAPAAEHIMSRFTRVE